MSWSTNITVPAEADQLPVLTDELVNEAREAVRAQLDEYAEHDTFDGAVAAARALLEFGPGPRVVYIGGHKSDGQRSCNANVTVPPSEGTWRAPEYRTTRAPGRRARRDVRQVQEPA